MFFYLLSHPNVLCCSVWQFKGKPKGKHRWTLCVLGRLHLILSAIDCNECQEDLYFRQCSFYFGTTVFSDESSALLIKFSTRKTLTLDVSFASVGVAKTFCSYVILFSFCQWIFVSSTVKLRKVPKSQLLWYLTEKRL